MRTLFFLSALFVFPGLATAQEPTTGTLRLAEIFDLRPGAEGFQPSPGRFDPSGPVVIIPDTSAWRLPPSPTPTPLPTPFLDLKGDPVSLPRLPLRISGAGDEVKVDRGPAFVFRGSTIAVERAGLARLRILTPFRLLRVQYIISSRPDGTGSRPVQLIFLHTPGTSEEFDLPAGEYRLVRRLWRVEKPDSLIEEEYDYQHLDSSGQYDFSPDPGEEQGLLAKLRTLDR